MQPEPPQGYCWVEGRLTKKQPTRPDNCWPELWQSLHDNQDVQAQKEWARLAREREEQRAQRGICRMEEHKKSKCEKCLAGAIAKYSLPDVPGMETTSTMISQ